MLKLEKYLLENADEAKQSISTNSKYYTFEGIKIRISDHYAIDKDNEMQIILPTNGSPYYTVFLKGSKRCLTWRAKQIIEYIPNFILTKKMYKPLAKEMDDLEAAKNGNEETVDKGPVKIKLYQSRVDSRYLSKILKVIYEHPKATWNDHDAHTIHLLFIREFGISKGTNNAFMNFLKTHKVSYVEAINIYYQLVIKQSTTPNSKNIKKML